MLLVNWLCHRKLLCWLAIPVSNNLAVQGVAVDGERVDRVSVFGVPTEHQVALVGHLEVGNHERTLASVGSLGGVRSDRPHVLTLFDGVDVDGAILRPGGCHIKLRRDGHAGHGLVVPRQNLNSSQVLASTQACKFQY